MFDICTTVLAINPKAQVSVSAEGTENEIITWHGDTTPISKADIQAKQAELQAEYDSQEYARKRKAEYDQLNQFEMQFDDQRDGTTTWVDAINAIKAKYPKP